MGVRDVCNLFDLSETEVVPEVREWGGVREEGGGGGGAKEGGRRRNLEVVRDKKNDLSRVNPTGDKKFKQEMRLLTVSHRGLVTSYLLLYTSAITSRDNSAARDLGGGLSLSDARAVESCHDL